MSSRLRDGETGRRTHYTHMQTLLGDFFLAFCLAKGIPPLWAHPHPRLTRWIRACCPGQQPWECLAGIFAGYVALPFREAGSGRGLGIYCRISFAPTRSAMDSCILLLCAAKLVDPQTALLDKASGPLGCPRCRSALALSAAPCKNFHCQAA
jgi:hypothetical protein